MYDRSRLDLNVSAADRQLSTTELIARQNANRNTIDLALLERLYDSGRYLFISSSGVLPPRLTGIWAGTWNGAWADDFTTDANVNLQVAGGNILDLTDAMQGYFNLILGQLAHWRTNARNLYGARGFLAPSRTDGEYGYMLHFDAGFPGQCWTGGADWLLYPLLEYYQVTGDRTFLADKLGPALMELALFYEDFLTRTDSAGQVVFVPSFSMENSPASTNVLLAINATGDIQAGKHALRAAIDAANALGVEQGAGQGVARWTALLAKLPAYTVNGSGALAEWSWPGLTDRYNHRHVHHLYGAWPLHEINPEEATRPGHRRAQGPGAARRREHLRARQPAPSPRLRPAQGRRRRLQQPPEDHRQQHDLPVADDLPQPEPGDLQRRCGQRAARRARRSACSTPGPASWSCCPPLPDQFAKGTITGVRGRNQVRIAQPLLGSARPLRHRDAHLDDHPGDNAPQPARDRIRHHLRDGHPLPARPTCPGDLAHRRATDTGRRRSAGRHRRRRRPAGQPAQWQGAGRQRRLHRGRGNRHPVAVDRRGQPAVAAAAQPRRLIPAVWCQERKGPGQSRRLRPGRGTRPVGRQRRSATSGGSSSPRRPAATTGSST